MKERPILFSGPMVRAILEGRKTHTRRIAKPVKHPDLGNIYAPGALVLEHEPQHVIDRACPYGQPGDRLWVREAWCPANSENGPVVLYPANDDRRYLVDECYPIDYDRYPAGRAAWAAWAADVEGGTTKAYRPSIHMPRWASRILLKIVSVRLERLNECSERDAIAEGVFRKLGNTPLGDDVETATGGMLIYARPDQAREEFKRLWESINGASSWQSNPWVWVVEFKQVPP